MQFRPNQIVFGGMVVEEGGQDEGQVGIVRSVAASDPEIAALQDELERRRRSDLRGLVQLLAEAGPLRVSVDDAVDLWWALGHPTGPYRALTADRKWSDRQARVALIDIVARTLLDEP